MNRNKKIYILLVKPIFDYLLAILILPFFILLCIPIGLLIKIEDKGPVFFKANRIGRHYKIFKMYKFRTMRVNAELLLNSDGSTYNAKDDPRVTRIGKFLRETSLDEVPQVLNVLRGEMSFIGPRASLEGALGTFQEDEIAKMDVLPGISGYVQAYHRNGLSNREKRLKDAWYAEHCSLILDIKIFFKTILTIFKRKNLYTNGSTS